MELIGTLLAAIKVVASGEILLNKNIKLHPVDLLNRMAPLAFLQCAVLAVCTGELQSICLRWNRDFNPFVTALPTIIVAVSGVLAFTLNVTALQAYRVTSPLTCCIVAAVKQVLTILIGTMLFRTQVTLLNALGIAVVLIASTAYSYIAVIESTPTVTQVNYARQNESQGTEDETEKMIDLERANEREVKCEQRCRTAAP